MGTSLEQFFGRVVDMQPRTDGDQLVADAAIGATTLYVGDTTDFDEFGGEVQIGTIVYEYDSIDTDANTLHLPLALSAAAAQYDRVDVWDTELQGLVVEYVANVLLDDQDPDDEPIEVTVQHGLVNLLQETIRGGASESVTLLRDGDDDLMIWQINGKYAVDVALDAVKVSLEAGVAGAISSADTAQATANGKNTVHYSTSTPGSTPNIVGDIWWQYSSGIIIGQWTGAGGTSWTPTTIGSTVIANLDAGKITVGILSGIEITGVTIASSAYTQGSVADGQIVLTDEGGAYGSVMKFLAPSSGIESARLIGTSGGAALVGVGSMVTGLKTLSGGVDRYLMFRSSGGNLLYVNGGLTIDQGDVTIAGGHKITASGEAHGSTLWSDAPNSTAQPTANVYMTAGGQLQIMTSTESAKTNIRPADIDIAAALALEPKVYQSLCDADDPDTDIFGFSAQQAKALGLDAWVVYEADGQTVQGFSYTGWVVALQATNRHQQTQIDDLTAKVEHLTGIVEQLAANQTTSGDA